MNTVTESTQLPFPLNCGLAFKIHISNVSSTCAWNSLFFVFSFRHRFSVDHTLFLTVQMIKIVLILGFCNQKFCALII